MAEKKDEKQKNGVKAQPGPEVPPKAEESTPEKTSPKVKYYYSKAADLTMSGFKPQVKATDGSVISPDVPVQFDGHLLRTDDPEMWEFVEKSSRFVDQGAVNEVSYETYLEIGGQNTMTEKLKNAVQEPDGSLTIQQ